MRYSYSIAIVNVVLLLFTTSCGNITARNRINGTLTKIKETNIDINEKQKNCLISLHEAARAESVILVRKLIQEGANVNEQDEFDNTPLHYAAETGHMSMAKHGSIVRELLEARANVNMQNKDGNTPLHLAAESGYVSIVQLLLGANADVNVQNKDGDTPLNLVAETIYQFHGHDHAIKDDYEKVIIMLIYAQGYDRFIDYPRIGETSFNERNYIDWVLFRTGAKEGDWEAVQHFLKRLNIVPCLTGKELIRDRFSACEIDLIKRMRNEFIRRCNAILDMKVEDGDTCLHLAAREGDLRAVEQLLKVKEYRFESVSPPLIVPGIDVNQINADHSTALHLSASRGHLEVVQRLLEEKNICINKPDKYGWTPLHLAARNGHPEVVQRLLEEKNICINKPNKYGWTPLHLAAGHGHEKVVEELLKASANVNAIDIDSFTPLHISAVSGHPEVVQKLLEAGANINAISINGYSSLNLSARNGHLKVVEILLREQTTSVNAIDSNGHTALHIASRNGHLEVVEKLLKEGADVNAKGIIKVFEMIPLGPESGKRSLKETLESMNLDLGIDVDRIDIDLTPNHYVGDIKSLYGWTPLHLAAVNSNREIVEILLENGADIDKEDSDGMNALHYVAQMGNLAVVKLLLERGADIDKKDKNGHTPLDLARKNNYSEIKTIFEYYKK